MRSLSRSLALTAALILTGLTLPGAATTQTLGTCHVRCTGSWPFTTYQITTTKADCCSGNYSNHCPAGSTPVTQSWNSMRCAS